MAKKDQAPQSGEPNYDEDLQKVIVRVLAEESTVDQAVKSILTDWDVEEADVRIAIETAQADAQKAKDQGAEQKAKDQAAAEALAAKQAQAKKDQTDPVNKGPKTTVTVTVPKGFKLRTSHDEVIDYKAGIQEMPPEHADHWYSIANGVKKYEG